MNLGFHYHVPILILNDGKIKTAAFLGVFLDTLSKHVNSLTIYAYEPLESELYMLNYEILSNNIIISNLGLHNSIPKRFLRLLLNFNTIKKNIKSHDQFLVRAPTPLLPFIYLFRFNLPIVQYLVGSYYAANKNLTGPIIKLIFIKTFNYVIEKSQQLFAQRKITIVNSKKLFDEYLNYSNKVTLIQTTTLTNADFFLKNNKIEEPIKILYTGGIMKTKGLKEILETCIFLNKNGINCEFHFAGMKDNLSDLFIEELFKIAKFSEFSKLYYHGFKNAGTELNLLYRDASIFITLPMNHAEGFPRVIWEAMANSCPVITSNFGSIPYFLTNDFHAIILDKFDVVSISNAIIKIVNDNDFTNSLRKNAFDIASTNTQDLRCLELSKILKNI